MIGVAVVGCGYWGPNLVRNFSMLDGAELKAICDHDQERLDQLSRTYPALRCETAFESLTAAADIDAIVISTPIATHYPLAKAALEAGKHVMVEKPLSHSVATASALVELAESSKLVLHVDHTFVYSGAVQKIKDIMDSGDLGELLYIDCVRINLGQFQSDVNVIWDLAPHDLSIVQYLLKERPESVSTVIGAQHGELASQAYLALQYPGSLLVHSHVNWLSPLKIRSILIGGSLKMIVYDDLAASEQVRVYDKAVIIAEERTQRQRALVDYRIGDMHAPHINKSEPLRKSCQAFIESIESGQASPTDGHAGLDVVRALEAADQSLRSSGERVYVDGSQ